MLTLFDAYLSVMSRLRFVGGVQASGKSRQLHTEKQVHERLAAEKESEVEASVKSAKQVS